jgi:hypothetical protein
MALVQAFGNWVREWKPVWELITVERIKAFGILFAAGTFAVAYFDYRHKGQEERLQRALSLIEKINTEPAATRYRALATSDADEEAAKWKAIEARRGLVVHFRDRFDN